MFHHVPDKNINIKSSKTINDKDFTGDVYSTDLDGRVLSGFSINKGTISGSYNPRLYAGDPIRLNEVIIINSYHRPVATNSAYTRMNYQFVRSQNNGSSMGLAYAAYYKSLQSKKINDEIKDGLLKPCLKKILDNLKKTAASPGNMIVNFTGSWANGYNWTVQTGTINGEASGTTNPTYNLTTGVTTTFDSQKYPEATDLSWARTMLHESIHAYLVTYFKVDKPGWIATYPQMVTDWGVKQNWNAVHHEEIARSLVKSIGEALEVYGISQGFNLTKQFYEDMAWGGLQTSDAFKALPSSEKQRISDTLATELTGMDTNGDTKPQKGKKAGC